MNKLFYIPNLNGLRFLAAFMVIIGHIELTKKSLGIPNLIQSKVLFFSNGGGHLGVILFFVLSGFLITLLLLKERAKQHYINYQKFFLRRLLRIWPVYFMFITVIIFIFHGYDNIKSNILNYNLIITLYYLILPNLAISGIGTIQFISHLWSIGVEEQFYLIWPFLFKKWKDKLIIIFLIITFITIPFIPHACDYFSVRFNQISNYFRLIRLFFSYFLINAMAIGALMAYLYFYYYNKVKFFFSFKITVILFSIIMLLWLLNNSLGFYKDSLYMVMFAILILGLSVNNPWLIFENKIINYLGKISYGLYVYHWVIIYYTHNIFYDTNYYNIKLYIFSILFTIIISIFSFELIEKKVLKFKNRFSVIKT